MCIIYIFVIGRMTDQAKMTGDDNRRNTRRLASRPGCSLLAAVSVASA